MHEHHHVPRNELDVFVDVLTFGMLILLYCLAVFMANKKYQKWPMYRFVLWSFGVVCIAFSLVGPVADRAHTSFQAHMITHLLLGMLGPLLLVFAAPMTLLLRTLKVRHARLVSKWLKSSYIRFVSHPITASILNVGGLWLLYTTDLYHAIHSSTWLYVFVHLHVFLAGYIFTISMIYIDPTPHRYSFVFRSVVLIVAMAGHGILSKWTYANPPTGIAQTDAELGGMLMYYGGDVIDLILVIAMCAQYFKLKKRKLVSEPSKDLVSL